MANRAGVGRSTRSRTANFAKCGRLVTVSPIWAGHLHRRHGKDAEVVYNGYAAEDFPPKRRTASHGEVLTIRYMGSIYPGFRDPSTLFAAIGLLPDALRDRMKVEFFSDAGDALLDAAATHWVINSVAVEPRIPYRRALELQMQSDVLLLLQSNDRRDEGNLPAKLFEYLYARRPILFIGYEQGIAARLVRDRGAGLVSNCPARIRDQLQIWLQDKRAGAPQSARPIGQSWPQPRRAVRKAGTPFRGDCRKTGQHLSSAAARRGQGDQLACLARQALKRARCSVRLQYTNA